MPRGIYIRTKNLGLKPIQKNCIFCVKDFTTNCLQPKKKYCSISCYSKFAINNPKFTKLGKDGSVKQREFMRSRIGEKHHAWIKDRTQIIGRHNRNFHDPNYKQWHNAVKIRDNWKCKISNQDCNGRLEAHHIFGWKIYPELRYEINNGITLCHFHHPRKRDEEKRMIQFFQELLTLS